MNKKTDLYELKVWVKTPAPKDPFETRGKIDMHVKDHRKAEIIKCLQIVIQTLEKTPEVSA